MVLHSQDDGVRIRQPLLHQPAPRRAHLFPADLAQLLVCEVVAVFRQLAQDPGAVASMLKELQGFDDFKVPSGESPADGKAATAEGAKA